MASDTQFCTFYVDDLCFGVEVQKVQEVIRFQGVTSVPLAPSVIAGLINLRGQIVTAIDLRRRMNLREREADRLPMNVVLHSEEGAVSLLVDEIGDVLDVDDSTFEPPPATLVSGVRELIRGVYKLDGRLLIVLDAQKVINPNERSSESKSV